MYRRTLFKCVVKCLRFREKREIASLIFAFARGFTWFARGFTWFARGFTWFARGFTWFARDGSLFYCVLLNAIVEKTRNSQLLDSRI